jgi:chloramphenicol 3-O-phosphotransferase
VEYSIWQEIIIFFGKKEWYNFYMVQKLIILRGAPASGKTSISENLRDFDKKIVWFKTDNLKEFFSDPNEARIRDEVMETCLAALKNILDRGYSVVYEGIFVKPEYVNWAVEIGKDKNIPVVIYQLECSLDTLKQRDKNRKGVPQGLRKAMPEEVIESLYKKVEENPIEGAISLNTEEKSLEECINIIRQNFEQSI